MVRQLTKFPELINTHAAASPHWELLQHSGSQCPTAGPPKYFTVVKSDPANA